MSIDTELKVICIILARGGSKGLHRKNLRIIDGEPLVVRAIRHAKESNSINTILVSTDDQEIADISTEAGAEVPFIRPQALSKDETTTEDSLKHALLNYEAISGVNYDIGVFITATDIFRQVKWIKEAINKLVLDDKLESVFSGHKTHKNYWEKLPNGKWKRVCDWMSVYSSRQIRRSIVREDTGLACASRAWLWRQGRRIGDIVDIIENDDDFTNIDIHQLEDLQLAQSAIDIRKKQNDK